jgi:NitT/TauT family transport system substrate-binding protein
VHQAQFAGFYLAQEKGYFSLENIEVTFLEGGQGINPIDSLLSGEADFSVVSPEDLLIKRSQGAPLIAIAAIYRRSAVVFAAKAYSGIVNPTNFSGKTIALKGSGISDFELQFYAMMKKLKIDHSEIRIVTYDPQYTAFYEGDVDITPTYCTGGLIRMRERGIDPNLIWPNDYGLRFYSDILVTTEKMVEEKADLATRFMRASIRGWQDAVGDCEQAVASILKYARIKNQKLQTAMMEASLPLIHTGTGNIGTMDPEIWQEMYIILKEKDLLASSFDVKKAYDMRFLNKIYGVK